VVAVLTGAGGAVGLVEVLLAGGFLALGPAVPVAQSWVRLAVLHEALDAALSLAVAVGLWRMRRWSVALYGGLMAINLAVAMLLWPLVADAALRAAVGGVALAGIVALGLLLPGVALVVMLRHYAAMR
jgi:hypothetical protein